MTDPVVRRSSRPASTPPSARTSARASAPPTKVTRASKPSKPPTLKEAWAAAEDTIPNLDAAIEFLQRRSLIPEGVHAVTGTALVSGLLHFAASSPAETLAREGLIAFAFVADDLLGSRVQEAVSDAVVERAEDQLRIRLDHHTSHVEDKLDEFAESVDKTKQELERCTQELREACERVKKAEDALGEARREVLTAGPTALVSGASPTVTAPASLDMAPVHVRRAATVADLLQRQILVRGATLNTDDGTRMKDAEVRDWARSALDEMARAGLTPPGDGTIEQAKILPPHDDVVLTASSVEMARWVLKPTVAKPFARKMGLTAQVIE
ncbi:hypothetical protein C8T65DRAFT_751808, partial [Cerioporus squamosus]